MELESLGKDKRELPKCKAPNGASDTGSERVNPGLAPAASSLKGEPNTRECVRKRAMESLPGREVASNHREMARQTRRLQRIVKRVHPRNSGGEFRQDEQNTYPWVRLG